MNNDQKRTVLALVLSGIVLFGWQILFAPNEQIQQAVKQDVAPSVVENTTVETTQVTKTEQAPVPAQLNALSDVTLSYGVNTFTINSDFSIKEAVGFDTNSSLEDFSGKPNFFKVKLINSNNALETINLQFDGVKKGNSVNAYDTARDIKVTFILNDRGQLHYTVTSPNAFRLAYVMSGTDQQSDNRLSREFLLFGGELDRITVEDDEATDGSLRWFGMDFNYHLFANVLPKKETFKFVSTETGEMYFQAVQPTNVTNGYLLYSLKNYDHLVGYKDQLDLSIDFGLFGILAVPILKGMQFLYKYLGNYGWAIIILTLGIRFLTFPLQYKSFKSMKKMQTVQPEIAKLKEKYKDDPARIQKETMELFKRAGANPLGGCLPMLLQVPFFIAFYQAINNSVELVGSPFAGWIVDLSAKDPFYVLPVLMGLTMLLQTKLNPSTTADPNQQKIMYLMPLVFCFIMKDLPAGLNLYFTVSNILGIAQQMYVYKTVD